MSYVQFEITNSLYSVKIWTVSKMAASYFLMKESRNFEVQKANSSSLNAPFHKHRISRVLDRSSLFCHAAAAASRVHLQLFYTSSPSPSPTPDQISRQTKNIIFTRPWVWYDSFWQITVVVPHRKKTQPTIIHKIHEISFTDTKKIGIMWILVNRARYKSFIHVRLNNKLNFILNNLLNIYILQVC